MKARQTRRPRQRKQKGRKQRRLFSRRRSSLKVGQRGFSRKNTQKGGVNLPVPNGSVVAVDLDPQDAYSAPVLVSKEQFEEEVLDV